MYFDSGKIYVLSIHDDRIYQYFLSLMCSMYFSALSPQEANSVDKSTTKAESAWLFRMWYSFDHKYPSVRRPQVLPGTRRPPRPALRSPEPQKGKAIHHTATRSRDF